MEVHCWQHDQGAQAGVQAYHTRVVARVLAALDTPREEASEFAGTDESDSAHIDQRLDDFAAVLFLGLAVEAWRNEGRRGRGET